MTLTVPVPELLKLNSSPATLVPRTNVLLLFLLITPVLVKVSEPWLPWVCRTSPEFKFKVPAFTMALVPGSSSTLPAMLTVPPAEMFRVRPANVLPETLPLKFRVAPLATVTLPPPLQ